MHIVIVTVPGDLHAHAVSWALKNRGHTVTFLYPLDICRGAQWSLISDSCVLHVRDGEEVFDIELCEVDVLWNRRVPTIFPMHGVVDIVQRAVSEGEVESLVTGILLAFEQYARCINPISSMLRSHRKINQISCAKANGLAVPDTIFTNDLNIIKLFFNKHGKIVYKPQKAFPWRLSNGRVRVPPTTVVDELTFFDGVNVQSSPSIYQECIEKFGEVRSIFMDESTVSWAAKPSSHNQPEVDWRFVNEKDMLFESCRLPENVKEKCRSLMTDLGINFGCFDFAIDRNGDYIFLEVNPSGQFLYGDDLGLNLNILGDFVRFLEGKGETKSDICLIDYLRSVDYTQSKEIEGDKHYLSFLSYRFARASVELAE